MPIATMHRHMDQISLTFTKHKHRWFKSLRKGMSLIRIRDNELKSDSEDGDSMIGSFDQEPREKYASELDSINRSEPPSKPAKGDLVGLNECLQTYVYCT